MLEQEPTSHRELTEHDVQEMILLAARLRESHGSELDDEAIQAVSEATNIPADYVRIALASTPAVERQTGLSKLRSLYLSFDPDVRRYVASSWLASVAGLLGAVGNVAGDPSSFLGIATILCVLGALWNSAQARNTRVASISGALFGGLWFVSHSAFLFLYSFWVKTSGPPPPLLLLYIALGAIGGGVARRILDRSLSKLGMKDSAETRQELLRQLVDLQDRLRTGERSMTFLSIDVAGSTKMKEGAEPLDVEFTFTEYHRYVESVIRRHGGTLHSTAGDGVTVAFDDPAAAFRAARNLQSGLIELNTHRNRLGVPIRLRIGMHSGTVIAPGQDIQSVNFAHVIDIAAHLQKVCPIGGVAVSEAAARGVPGGPGSIGEETVAAQDVAAVVWRPKVELAVGSSPAS